MATQPSLADQVREARSFAQLQRVALFAAEASQGGGRQGLHGDGRFVSGSELYLTLRSVQEGRLSLSWVTKRHGFQRRAAQLLGSEQHRSAA